MARRNFLPPKVKTAKQEARIRQQIVIGKTIALARNLHAISQQDLAEHLDISVSTIQNYESGASCPNAVAHREIGQILPSYAELELVAAKYLGNQDTDDLESQSYDRAIPN